jgi:hypothetical protein
MLFARGRVYMITGARFAAHYAHWGFAPVEPTHAPSGILRNYLLGRLAGFASRVTGRTPNPARGAGESGVTPVRLLQRSCAKAPARWENRVADVTLTRTACNICARVRTGGSTKP